MKPVEVFGSVGPPWWSESTVILVGGGPSLLGFDRMRFNSCGRVVGVNQSMLDTNVSAGITSDRIFVQKRFGELYEFAKSRPLFIAIGNVWLHIAEQIERATYLKEMGGYGVSKATTHVHGGSTSGFAALNVAVLKGARRILLAGYDYGTARGRHHYHESYPWFDPHQNWKTWATQFEATTESLKELGVEVMNASPESAIEAFPRCTLEEGLEWARV